MADKSSILWYKYFSKYHKEYKNSYILPNRIHTIDRKHLTDDKKIKTHKLDNATKNKIIDFVGKILNDK
ncbi:MAG: hypothetical protein LBJ97_02215 [Mycoplasmataceae bacterium]|nr:hypothetical protein [Mycoplasmataceae bacterium]